MRDQEQDRLTRELDCSRQTERLACRSLGQSVPGRERQWPVVCVAHGLVLETKIRENHFCHKWRRVSSTFQSISYLQPDASVGVSCCVLSPVVTRPVCRRNTQCVGREELRSIRHVIVDHSCLAHHHDGHHGMRRLQHLGSRRCDRLSRCLRVAPAV